jgi:hypothetical protein
VPDREPMAASVTCRNDHDVEPNEGLAQALAPDSGAGCASTVAGVIAGGEDVDVFRTGSCNLNGNAKTATLTKGDDSLRLCVFAACGFGTTNVYNCFATDPNDSGYSHDDAMMTPDQKQNLRNTTHVSKAATASGFNGCCRTGRGTVSAEVECGNFGQSTITTWIWIDSGNSTDNTCHSYSVDYQTQ